MSRILALAVVVAAALVATIVWEVQAPVGPEPGATPGRPVAPGRVRAAPAADPAAAAQGWMATALERPLFKENRRADKSSTDMAVKGEGPMRLTGVITGPFGNNAIFMAAGDAKPLVVTEGMQVGDFVIRSIEPGQVVVEGDGNVRTLTPAFVQGGQPVRR
jgi:hypothetical protein